jgi:hypothetical protein
MIGTILKIFGILALVYAVIVEIGVAITFGASNIYVLIGLIALIIITIYVFVYLWRW